MAKRPDIERLRMRLKYDRASGAMTWVDRPLSDFEGYKQPANVMYQLWAKRFKDRPAFAVKKKSGHLAGRFENYEIYAHQVIWALEHNEWPVGEINHINGNPEDNRIENLRLASRKEITRNQSLHADSKSGHLGVSRRADTGKWVAKIGSEASGDYAYLGCFNSLDEAVRERELKEAALNYHANHGKRPSRREK